MDERGTSHLHVCTTDLLKPWQDPNDLSFQVGEIVEIVKETNADWWTGRNRAGKEGLFPSSYVEKLAPRSISPLAFPEFPKTRTSHDLKYGLTEPKYPPPSGPPQYSAPQPPQQQYPPPSGPPPASGYLPPSGPSYNPYPGSPPVAQPIPQQPPKKSRFGGLGTTVGLPTCKYWRYMFINSSDGTVSCWWPWFWCRFVYVSYLHLHGIPTIFLQVPPSVVIS